MGNIFSWFNWTWLKGLITQAVTAAGVLLVGWGVLDEGAVGEFAGAAAIIVGLILDGISSRQKTKAVAVQKAVVASPAVDAVMVDNSTKAIIVQKSTAGQVGSGLR